MRDFFDGVDGPSFSTVIAQAVKSPTLGYYLPQVRLRRSLRGYLRESIYAVRASTVIGSRSRPLTADELRQELGLSQDTRLVLVLFDKDDVLERVVREGKTMIPALASAGYDWIVAPSLSCWEPRPRSEHLFNLKRSLWIFGALQEHGAAVVPRVGWATENDASRMAQWVEANPVVDLVGVDLMTYRGKVGWAKQIDLLRRFDQETGRRLRYLVNGPGQVGRFVDLYRVLEPERLTVTNLAIARPPRRSHGRRARPAPRRYIDEFARERRLLRRARTIVGTSG